MVLAKAKANAQYNAMPPLVINPALTAQGNAEFNTIMTTQDPEFIKKALKRMDLAELCALRTQIEGKVLQEASINTVAKHLVPLLVDITATAAGLDSMSMTIESAFIVIYTNEYYNNDSKSFDHLEFGMDIERAIARAEVIAEQMDD